MIHPSLRQPQVETHPRQIGVECSILLAQLGDLTPRGADEIRSVDFLDFAAAVAAQHVVMQRNPAAGAAKFWRFESGHCSSGRSIKWAYFSARFLVGRVRIAMV